MLGGVLTLQSVNKLMSTPDTKYLFLYKEMNTEILEITS